MTWGAIGGAAVGLIGNKLMSNSNGGAGTQTKEPWGPAKPFLEANLQKNADLQKFYEQNPFNAQQKTGYQNLFGDLDNFRQNTAPGLMGFANNAMTGSYQRPQFSRPGTAGYGGTPQTNQTPGGLLAMQPGNAAMVMPQGAPGANRSGPFSVAPGGVLGQIDWNAINPHSAQNAPVAPAGPAPMTQEELLRRLIMQNPSAYYGGFGPGNDGGVGNDGNDGGDSGGVSI